MLPAAPPTVSGALPPRGVESHGRLAVGWALPGRQRALYVARCRAQGGASLRSCQIPPPAAVKEFVGTGLERGAALKADIAEMEAKFGLTAPAPAADGPGARYAK